MNIEQTQPQLYRAGGYRIDQAIANPSVTLIETGDEFGFLLSESAFDTAIDSRLVLENVHWAKGVIFPGFFRNRGELARRDLDEVTLYRHDAGLYVAQDAGSHLYLPQPSVDPYVVVFISWEQYEELLQEIELADRESLLDSMAVVLDGVSGFTVDGDALIGPSTYARGVGVRLDYPVMDV
jgi:hypothetical protein